ncbi:MAG: hypothetical protein ACRDKH_03185 [Solirubrobacterales bacterium]
MSRAARIAIIAALAAAAVVLFIVLSGSDDDEDGGDSGGGSETTATGTQAPQPPPFEVVEMRNGEPVGGVQRLTYSIGDRIRIEVKLDEPQEDVHIHGYEQEVLNPTRSARFDFPAALDGVYELEAHGPSGDVPLAEIVVQP